MLDLTSTPAESLDYAVLKRVFDFCFSASVLLLTAPIFGLIALVTHLTSPGPVFFVQERVGLNGNAPSSRASPTAVFAGHDPPIAHQVPRSAEPRTLSQFRHDHYR
jgi:sugar transferase